MKITNKFVIGLINFILWITIGVALGLIATLLLISLSGCGNDIKVNEKPEDDITEISEQETIETCITTDICLEKQRKNTSAEVEIVETIKVHNPLYEFETGNNNILHIFYSRYDDKIYILKDKVQDNDYYSEYYPIDSIYCSLDNVEREYNLTLNRPNAALRSFYKVGYTFLFTGTLKDSETAIYASGGNFENLHIEDYITDDISIGNGDGVHFMYDSNEITHYVKFPNSGEKAGTMCKMDFNATPEEVKYNCVPHKNHYTTAISGTYFNDHIYVLVNNEIENVLLEFNDNFMYTKSYNISKLTKTTNVIRKSYLLADLENIYFVTIENDYLIFDRLQLIQYGEENK